MSGAESLDLAGLVLALFLLFCRIGSCIMVMPGFSSPRIPVRVRLFAAVAITLALAPLLVGQTRDALAGATDGSIALAVGRESVTGGTIGLLGRVMFAALETLCTAAAMATGFGNPLGGRIEDGEALPGFAPLLTLTAVTLFFVSGQHAELVRALLASYDAFPFGSSPDPRASLVQVVDALCRAFPLALQITGPFLVYGLVVNIAFGLLNRLTPQIPVYFIASPFVIAGGLAILYAVGGTLVALFSAAFDNWLVRG